MAYFMGKILDGQEVLLDPVQGDLQEAAGATWEGTFFLPSGTFLPLGKTFRLVLVDGRSGEFYVSGIRTGSDEFTPVPFRGSGLLA